MWNADIDYAYARTPETVSGAHALTVQKPVRKGYEGRFFWSSLILLRFCTEIGLTGNLWAQSVTQKSVGQVTTHPSHQRFGPKVGKIQYWKCWMQICWSGFWPTFEMTNPDVAPQNYLFSQMYNLDAVYPAGSLVSNVKCRCSPLSRIRNAECSCRSGLKKSTFCICIQHFFWVAPGFDRSTAGR